MRCNLFSSLKICIALTSLWRPAYCCWNTLLEKSEKKVISQHYCFLYTCMCSFKAHPAANLKRREQRERRPLAFIYLFLFVWRSKECTRGAIGNFSSALFPIVQKSAPRSNRWFAHVWWAAASWRRALNYRLIFHQLIISAAPISQLIVPKKSYRAALLQVPKCG